MKALTLTHNQSDKEVLVNWSNVLFAATTENNFGETYTEVVFGGNGSGAIPVKQTISEIESMLSNVDE